MLKCPVCKTSYKEEVSTCKKCYLSEQDIDLVNEIDREHPIFKICIPTLLKRLSKQNEQIKSYQINETLSKLNHLESKIQISTLEQNRNRQQIGELEKKLIILEGRLNNKNQDDQNLNLTLQENKAKNSNFESPMSLANIQEYSSNEAGNELPSHNFENFENNHNSLESFQETNINNIKEDTNNVFPQESDRFDGRSDRKSYISNISNEIKPYELQFANDYNSDKHSFESQVISVVTETQESMENRLAGRGEIVHLSDNNKGKYWIVEENANYYLVPGAKIRINEHNKHTIENLFEFDESDSGYDNFQLIKAAKVLKTNSELWQLENKGKIEFY